jgi:hypothetical protein
MAEINRPPPNPYWPWGANRLVREKIVALEQLERKQRAKRRADPKNPPLASSALLEFMGPGHTSEELRLPEPQIPVELQAELGGEVGLSVLRSIKDRSEPDSQKKLERGLTQVKATPERVERLRSLMRCETDMLGLMGNLHDAVSEIERLRREESKDEGY